MSVEQQIEHIEETISSALSLQLRATTGRFLENYEKVHISLGRPKWLRVFVQKSVEGYKVFLALKVTLFDYGIENCLLEAPPDVDAVWREHLLHPRDYLRVCTGIGGNAIVFDYAPMGTRDDVIATTRRACTDKFWRAMVDTLPLPRYERVFIAYCPVYEVVFSSKITIVFRMLDDQEFRVVTDRDELIHDIMTKLQPMTGIAVDKQRLVYAGNQLSKSLTPRWYNISDGTTVHLFDLRVVRLSKSD